MLKIVRFIKISSFIKLNLIIIILISLITMMIIFLESYKKKKKFFNLTKKDFLDG
jgi:hypothetical protein